MTTSARIEALLEDPDAYLRSLDYDNLLALLDGVAKLNHYCIECGPSRNIHARNLCRRCYDRLQKRKQRHPEAWQGWPRA